MHTQIPDSIIKNAELMKSGKTIIGPDIFDDEYNSVQTDMRNYYSYREFSSDKGSNKLIRIYCALMKKPPDNRKKEIFKLGDRFPFLMPVYAFSLQLFALLRKQKVLCFLPSGLRRIESKL